MRTGRPVTADERKAAGGAEEEVRAAEAVVDLVELADSG
jgi:hypothetical protein